MTMDRVPCTNPMPPANATYVHSPVDMLTVTDAPNLMSAGFHTNGQSNRVSGRMLADHFHFLRANKITPSSTYICPDTTEWLRNWS